MKRFLATLLFLLLLPCAAQAANRFGICATTCTWDGASTAMWSTTSGGATGASVPGATDNVVLDTNTCVGGTTCTITVNTNFVVNALTASCSASTSGCILDFSVNNNSGTMHTGFSDGSATGTRTINFGSGTFTVDNACSACTAWNTTGASTIVNAGTSTINIVTANNTNNWSFDGGPHTYNILNITGPGQGAMDFASASGNMTFAQLTVTGVTFLNLNGNITVTGFMHLNGTPTNPVNLDSFARSSQVTINGAGSFVATWAGIKDIKIANGRGIATNSMLFGNNSGINVGGGACILGG